MFKWYEKQSLKKTKGTFFVEGKKLDFIVLIIKVVTPFIIIGAGFGLYVLLYPNQFTDVGYAPEQPIAFSHKIHAGDLSLSCNYCHGGAEKSSTSGIPATETCMNCHRFVKTDSPEIEKIHKSFNEEKPIEWIRVHRLGDYVNFRHNVHVQAGIACSNCHGAIEKMDVVRQVKPLNMGFCLDCHRGKTEIVWDKERVTEPRTGQQRKAEEIKAGWLTEHRTMRAPENCSTCHY